jgi:hypothetical protein
LFLTLASTIDLTNFSTSVTSTFEVSSQIATEFQNSNTANKKLRIGIIIVGTVLVSLIVLSTMLWILRSIFRKSRAQYVTDDGDLATVYMEIDDGSNHGDTQGEPLGRTVIEEPGASPDDRAEERPELPDRTTVVLTSDVNTFDSSTVKDKALSMEELNVS